MRPASEVIVRVELGERMLCVEIADNGRGISTKDTCGRGDGVRNMEERMHAVKGEVVITSVDGVGTVIRLKAKI